MKKVLFNTSKYLEENKVYMYLTPSKSYLKNALNQLLIARKKTNIVTGSKYHKRLEKYRNDKDVIKFFAFCESHSIDPYNFIHQKTSKVLKKYRMEHAWNTTLYDHEIDLDSMYGAYMKFNIEDKIQNDSLDETSSFKEFIESRYSGIYNVQVNGSKVSFTSYRNTIFGVYVEKLEDETYDYTITPSIVFTPKHRMNYNRMTDYLNTCKYIYKDSDVQFAILKESIIIKGDKASSVIRDFNYFNKVNKLPCKKCNILVDNAFYGDSIQHIAHDGCR